MIRRCCKNNWHQLSARSRALFLCPDRDLVACGVSEGAAEDHDQIDKCPDAKATHGQQLGDACTGFANVKAVDTKPAQEKTQEKSWENTLIGGGIYGWAYRLARRLHRTTCWAGNRGVVDFLATPSTKNHGHVEFSFLMKKLAFYSGIPSLIFIRNLRPDQ